MTCRASFFEHEAELQPKCSYAEGFVKNGAAEELVAQKESEWGHRLWFLVGRTCSAPSGPSGTVRF